MDAALPLRGTSLHDGVAARLRALVFDGALVPGEFIDEKALAARLFLPRSKSDDKLRRFRVTGYLSSKLPC